LTDKATTSQGPRVKARAERTERSSSRWLWYCRVQMELVLRAILSVLLPWQAVGYTLRVCSWNLLAQEYIRPAKYPWCPPTALDWESRKAGIEAQISKLDAGVLCLQEVDVRLWSDLCELLERNGYSRGILQDTKNHPVATAVFLHDKLPMEVHRVESRSRALIVCLDSTTAGGMDFLSSTANPVKPIYVCSLHLEAGMSSDHAEKRFSQLKSLWRRLKNQMRIDGVTEDDASVILAGDFNMRKSDPMYTTLQSGSLEAPKEAQKRKKGPTKVPKKIPKFVDVFRSSAVLMNAKEDDDGLSARLLKTHFCGEIIDFVMVSDAIGVQNSLIPNPWAATTRRQMIPCNSFPSDHLPIGADVTVSL